jgi:hypothetical protein
MLKNILRPWDGDRKLAEAVKEYTKVFHSACTGQHTMNYYAPLDKADFYRSITQ